MELFPDRAHVRLRSRVHGAYLHANEDGVSVSLSGLRESMNTVWVVHRVQRRGTGFFLLRSAAYGRYLAFSPEHLQFASGGAVQHRYYDDFSQEDLLWVAIRSSDGGIFIRNCSFGPWYSPDAVTVMRWMVEAIPSRGVPPLLPAPTRAPMLFQRIIIYMKGHDDGKVDFDSAKVLIFQGRSVSHLREELASRMEECHPVRMTLCVWAGSHGRLTPLVVDLPNSWQTMEIVVFESWCRAAQVFEYPIVDA